MLHTHSSVCTHIHIHIVALSGVRFLIASSMPSHRSGLNPCPKAPSCFACVCECACRHVCAMRTCEHACSVCAYTCVHSGAWGSGRFVFLPFQDGLRTLALAIRDFDSEPEWCKITCHTHMPATHDCADTSFPRFTQFVASVDQHEGR